MPATNRSCPFCASIDLAIENRDTEDAVVCQSCGAAGPIAIEEESAWDLWNDRRCSSLTAPKGTVS